MRSLNILLAVVVLLLSLGAPVATPDSRAASSDYLELSTEKVIVFKDGHVLVIKKGTGRTNERGEIHTLQVPDTAILGSFWATADRGDMIGMRAGWREEESREQAQETALDTFSILRANQGQQCTVTLSNGETVEGTIREVLVKAAEKSTQPAGAPPSHRSSSILGSHRPARLPAGERVAETISRSETTFQGSHFVLRTRDGDLLLAASSVQALRVREMKTENEHTVVTKTRAKRLTFCFPEPNRRREITLMYFRPGLRWIPTYRADLPADDAARGGTKFAELSLQAEILNEAEDLVDVPVDIVVGVPNFRFKQQPSPLALESVLRNTLAESEPVLMGQVGTNVSNALYTQRSGEFRRESSRASAEAGSGSVDLSGELSAAGAQDLFVYSIPSLRLRRGDRAAVTVFKAKVPYRDVYTWDIALKREDVATAPAGQGISSPLELSNNHVWHQVELTNVTGMPWTTGAVMITRGRQPLGQELLTYTSAKGTSRVPVTVSVETRGSFREEEVDRILQALKWDGRHYAAIHSRAVLDLRNNKSHPIDVEISIQLGGRVEEATRDGEITLLPFNASDWAGYRGSNAVNNSSRAFWRATLGAGDTFQPEIAYHFYARH